MLQGAKNPIVVKLADTQRDKDSRKFRDTPHHAPMGGGGGGPMGGSGGAFGPSGGNNSQYAQVTGVCYYRFLSVHLLFIRCLYG